MTSLRVALVEDDRQLREALAQIVGGADGMQCVGAFATAEEAVAVLPGVSPDVVVMDIGLPGMTGIEGTRRLRAALPSVQIMMLTAFEDTDRVFESLQAGATGYVLKRAAAGEMLGAVREVSEGGAPMTGSIARKVVQFFHGRSPAPEVQALSDREREVLTALSEGQFYKEISDTLGISINTVRSHVKSIYDKLHVSSRMEAVSKFRGR